jgi:hypothetical protein
VSAATVEDRVAFALGQALLRALNAETERDALRAQLLAAKAEGKPA